MLGSCGCAAMLRDMVHGGFTGVSGRLHHVTMRHVGMVGRFLVAASFVMLGGFEMMFRGMLVMFGRLLMMVCAFVGLHVSGSSYLRGFWMAFVCRDSRTCSRTRNWQSHPRIGLARGEESYNRRRYYRDKDLNPRPISGGMEAAAGAER